MIALVFQKSRLCQQKNDSEYWRSQPYEARISTLEEARSEYHAWLHSMQKGTGDVEPGFQRVYRIVKR